jgi:methionine-rich copper-binding protein CopC/putative copper export protein
VARLIRNHLRAVLVCVVMLSFLNVGFTIPVQAHAFLQQALPAQEIVLDTSPDEVRLTFTEKIVHQFCEIELVGDNGTTVKQAVYVVDDFSMGMKLPVLPRGIYTVNWQVLSVDTHVTEDAYRFALGVEWAGEVPQESISIGAETDRNTDSQEQVSNENIAPAATGEERLTAPETEVAETVNESDERNESNERQSISSGLTTSNGNRTSSSEEVKVGQETAHDHAHHHHASENEGGGHVLHAILRVLDVVVAVSVVGALFFRIIVHHQSGLALPLFFRRTDERILLISAVVASLITGSLHVWHLSQQLAGDAAVDVASIGVLLASTLLGLSVTLKVIFYLAALASPWGPLRLVLAMSVLVLFPLSGHAMSAPQPLAAVGFHFLHMAMTACWLGGLVGIAGSLFLRPRDTHAMLALVSMIQRFSSFAVPLLVVTVLTGFASALDKFDGWSQLWTTMYGWILLSKGLLMLLLIGVAIFHRLKWLPALRRSGGADEGVLKGVRWEIALMSLAFLLAGLLSVSPPGI